MKILHLEDSADDATLIYEVLRDSATPLTVTRVETRDEFLDAMNQSDWDLILADYTLPFFDGISAMKLAASKHPELPFIFVTGSLGEEVAVEMLKNGATDYVLKHRLDRLPQAVNRAKRESESARAREQAERKIETSLREKELLLQEVHHRVKNNLQVICSLLNMQASTINDPLLASALQKSQSRIQSMAAIHEMLYASRSLSDINFAEYIRSLAAEISESYGVDATRIRLAFDLEPVNLEIGHAIPCGLILNELLSNALKYAFPNGESGEVRISIRQDECWVRLSVEDTGIGLPEGGVSGETKSLGLRIVHILTQQLGGSMETSSDQGAHFVLKFARTVSSKGNRP